MTVKKNYKSLAKRLKKQLNAYKRKEKASRNKLRAALAKMKQMGKTFERKLEQKDKESKAKVVAAQSAVYEKLSKAIKKKTIKRKLRK